MEELSAKDAMKAKIEALKEQVDASVTEAAKYVVRVVPQTGADLHEGQGFI